MLEMTWSIAGSITTTMSVCSGDSMWSLDLALAVMQHSRCMILSASRRYNSGLVIIYFYSSSFSGVSYQTCQPWSGEELVVGLVKCFSLGLSYKCQQCGKVYVYMRVWLLNYLWLFCNSAVNPMFWFCQV